MANRRSILYLYICRNGSMAGRLASPDLRNNILGNCDGQGLTASSPLGYCSSTSSLKIKYLKGDQRRRSETHTRTMRNRQHKEGRPGNNDENDDKGNGNSNDNGNDNNGNDNNGHENNDIKSHGRTWCLPGCTSYVFTYLACCTVGLGGYAGEAPSPTRNMPEKKNSILHGHSRQSYNHIPVSYTHLTLPTKA